MGRRDGMLLQHVSADHSADNDVVIAALSQTGLALKFAQSPQDPKLLQVSGLSSSSRSGLGTRTIVLSEQYGFREPTAKSSSHVFLALLYDKDLGGYYKYLPNVYKTSSCKASADEHTEANEH